MRRDDDSLTGLMAGKRLVVAVCGGIAAYKACELVRLCLRAGAEVKVAMTANATRFVTPLTFTALSNFPVVIDTFDLSDSRDPSEHISLARWADAITVAPATANILAKAACGIADDFVSTLLLSATCPVIFAPAMNTAMWDHPATKANVATLRGRGSILLPTGVGPLADSQEFGEGRLLEPEDIFDALLTHLPPTGLLSGRRVLISAGPTWEAIDPVRIISNRSTGKMGYALATAALAEGADVTLVSGPSMLAPPPAITTVLVESAKEMHRAISEQFASHDALIMAAAVSDWRPSTVDSEKVKKSGGVPLVELTPNDDILKEVSRGKRDNQVVVGFAMETHDAEAGAQKKLREKKLDLLVLNVITDADAGFGVDTNVVTVFAADGSSESWPKMSKRQVSDRISGRLAELLEEKNERQDDRGDQAVHSPADRAG